LKDVHFHKSLLMEPLLISNDLHRDQPARLVIDASDDLPEAALAEHVDDFISIRQVVAKNDVVVAALIVVTEVCRGLLHITDNLLGVARAAEEDFFVVLDLSAFEDVEVHHLDRLTWNDAILWMRSSAQLIHLLGGMLKVLALRGKFLHQLIRSEVILVQVGV
jgi:hypothetical protein